MERRANPAAGRPDKAVRPGRGGKVSEAAAELDIGVEAKEFPGLGGVARLLRISLFWASVWITSHIVPVTSRMISASSSMVILSSVAARLARTTSITWRKSGSVCRCYVR